MRMIARAAAELFAVRGFHATSSRDIATACGISEALMFRYFPTKEVLWSAALESCRRNAVADALRSIPDDGPSTRSLIELTLRLVVGFLADKPVEDARNSDTLTRMMLRSMAEDGEFAKMVQNDLPGHVVRYVIRCIDVGRAEAEMELPEDESIPLLVSGYLWFLFSVPVQKLTATTSYRGAKLAAVIISIVRPQLRSIGIKQQVITDVLTEANVLQIVRRRHKALSGSRETATAPKRRARAANDSKKTRRLDPSPVQDETIA